ncbi:MAG TPA: fumarylacetoacetate hydrolase family protein [Acidisarcina sp.]|nr:fumarylacetoacetate hydrolase family protein [Acidisarcina sp.]
MKYCRFQTQEGPQYGEVVDRNGELWIERRLPPPQEDHVTRLSQAKFEPILFATATLLAPVMPSKIVCIGRNYSDHVKELGNDFTAEPLLFLKAPSSLLAPGGTIRIPAVSERVDFEGELAVVIGRRASRIGPEEDVKPYIRGYTIVNDVTARDLQKKDGQWSRAKGFDTFCPVGPLVSDEIDPVKGVTVETRLNGELRQHGTTLDLIFPVSTLLRYITAAITLEPGDLIPTGTPSGVGPMRPGNQVSVTIEGLGTLTNMVA